MPLSDPAETTEQSAIEQIESGNESDFLDSRLWFIFEDIDFLEKLSPEQVQALIPIARGDRINSVAAQVNRGEKTIDRWLKQEEFKKAVNITVSRIYTYGLRSCAFSTIDAVQVLKEAARDKRCRMSDRIRAAQLLIEQGDRWQNFKLEEKLIELEKRLASREDLRDDSNRENENEAAT